MLITKSIKAHVLMNALILNYSEWVAKFDTAVCYYDITQTVQSSS